MAILACILTFWCTFRTLQPIIQGTFNAGHVGLSIDEKLIATVKAVIDVRPVQNSDVNRIIAPRFTWQRAAAAAAVVQTTPNHPGPSIKELMPSIKPKYFH